MRLSSTGLAPMRLRLSRARPTVRTSEYFRQSNELFWLCGVEVPHAYLLIDGSTRDTTLYLTRRDDEAERGEGPRLSADDSRGSEYSFRDRPSTAA